MANMCQVEEEMLFYSQMPEGEKSEKRSRRRRKKAKAADVNEESGGGGGSGGKRRLTDAQVRFLEMNFDEERKLESGRKLHLAAELGLDPKQVAVWFQNRRVRWKNKLLEEEYLKLKNHHDASLADKCHLQNEVLKLKKQLSDAEEEIKRLSGGMNEGLQAGGGGGGGGGGEGGSPSSSSTTNTFQPTLGLGEFGVDGDDPVMYGYHEYNALSSYLMDLGYLL